MKSYTALVFGFYATLATASTPLITSPGYGTLSFEAASYTVGDRFQVGSDPLAITALGMFDEGTPGLTQSHSVGLWTETGALLALVDFSPGLSDFSDHGFLYQSLASPITLQPGVRYILGADYPDGTVDRFYANDVLEAETWSSAVTFINGCYAPSGSPFTFPALNVFGLSYVGANAQFVVVPEPSTVALLASAVGTLALWRVRLRRVFR